ncbi:MAG: hypothetical protein Q8S73_39460 [Deltaproteobacteria bacterium]|nr:hypothetical protein [Myxococcales bacterium]MDP3220245.1 hypothetical protein [Deltaproteobacteria bacterium]
MRASLLSALALGLVGCGSTIVLPPATDSGVAPADQGGVVDAPAVGDAPALGDTPATGDSGVAPLNGRWRLVRLEFEGEDGVRRTLTDVDSPLATAAGGEPVPARANGTLIVADDRLALTSGTLINGHFYTFDNGYSANGFGAAGLLDQASGRFTLPGSTMGLTLERNADGTLGITGDGFGTSRLTYARAPATAAVDRISTIGLAMIQETPPPPTGNNLRVALLWDLVGPVPHLETNGVAVRFTGRITSYPVVLAGPPPMEARARVGLATVALARIALYLDQDSSLTFDRNADRAIAISPVAIAWRDDTPGVDPMSNPVRDLSPGYQYVHVHGDSSIGRPAVTPFDNNNLVAPDLPVVLTMSSIPVIADVL